MQESSPSYPRAVAIAVPLLLALAVLGGVAAFELVSPGYAPALGEAAERLRAGDPGGSLAVAAAGGVLAWLAVPTLGPLLVALVLLLAGRSGGRTPGKTPPADGRASAAAATPAPVRPSPAVALRLLAVLQEEARLVDFVREDLSGHSDEQVGSAVRGIHAALRKAIDQRMTLEPILAGEDGDAVELPAGFAVAEVRVTGSPAGEPPYRGVLRHGGWRARDVRLPVPTEGSDPAILAPAEVEVG